MVMKPIRSMEEFRRRYYPKDVEREHVDAMTPEELGKRMAEESLRKATEAIKLQSK